MTANHVHRFILGCVSRTCRHPALPWPAVGLLLALLAGGPAVRADAKVRDGSPREEAVRIAGPRNGLKLGLRHVVMPDGAVGAGHHVVLILHGANLPTAGNADFPIAGRSMMGALAEMRLDVWALDFYGYGTSDRYPEMDEPADRHPPLGVAADCAVQLEAAVGFLKQKYRVDQIMMIGDSRGSLVAGLFATQHPESLSRLVLFGPITPFSGGPSGTTGIPAYDLVTPSELWERFTMWSETAGKPNALDPSGYPAFAATFLRSDPTSGTRTPPSVRVPAGRTADMTAIASGQFTYDPGKIRAPTLIVMGESDAVTTFAGAQWLLKSLSQAVYRRLVVIGHGSHTIQYEAERTQLYAAMAAFLR